MRIQHSAGFTLVEMAIVLVIIGLLLGGILSGSKVLDNARTQDLISSIQDVQGAAANFQAKYGFVPGDMPNATASMPTLPVACNAGNGNGQVDTAAEQKCAIEELVASGLLRGPIAASIPVNGVNIFITNRTQANAILGGLLPANWINVIVIQSQVAGSNALNCENAVQIDKALDDGNTTTGNFRTSAACGALGTDMNPNTLLNAAALRYN